VDYGFAPFFAALVPLLMLFFLLPGLAFGWVAGTIRSDRDVAQMTGETMATMGSGVCAPRARGVGGFSGVSCRSPLFIVPGAFHQSQVVAASAREGESFRLTSISRAAYAAPHLREEAL